MSSNLLAAKDLNWGDSVSAATPIGVVPAETLRFRTAADIALEQPAVVPWFVPGFVAPGTITEIDAKVKLGKTTLFGDLAHALVHGRPFLDRPTRPTSLLWATEERPTSFQETLKRSHLTDRTDVHVLYWHDAKHLTWPEIMRAVRRQAMDVGAGVILVDTLNQFAGLKGDAENNSGDALTAAEPIQVAAAEGLALVVSRHERKGGGDVGDSGRGSSAFSGVADIVIALRRGEGHTKPTVRVLHTLSRFSETPDTLVIELTERGYIALGTKGTVAVLEAERALLDRCPTSEDRALELDELLEGHTPKIARTVAQEALRKLSEAALIKRLGLGKKGQPYRYFRAVEVSAGTQIT